MFIIAPTKIFDTCCNLQKEINPLMDAKMLTFSSERKNYIKDVWDFIDNLIAD